MTVGPVARNEGTEAFFDGTARGDFMIRRCRPGNHFCRPQAAVCPECGATEFDEVAASGRARLVSWVVVPDRPRDGGPPGAPGLPAIVELEEGPWWWTKLVDIDPESLREGLELQVRFERAEGGEAVPVFSSPSVAGR